MSPATYHALENVSVPPRVRSPSRDTELPGHHPSLSQPSVSSLSDSAVSFDDATRHGPRVASPAAPDPPDHHHGFHTEALNSPPAPPPTPYHVFRYWLWEIVSIVLALGLLVAIFVILSVYEGRPLSDWKFLINLSTLLALVATIFRILILVPITSIISHSKWEWIGQERLLSDIQAIDSASRGPWGALAVIPRAAQGNTAALAAIVTSLLALATAPFVQQAMQTVECARLVPGVEATLPYAHFVPRFERYYETGYSAMAGMDPVPNDTKLLVDTCQAGLETSEGLVRANCATGNCTFADGDPAGEDTSHSTIAMCHQCVDISSLISTRSNGTRGQVVNGHLPNGFISSAQVISQSDAVSNLTWAGDMLATPEIRRLASATLLNVTMLTMGANQTLTAGVCILYTCLRSYTASVRNTQIIERELPSMPASLDLRTSTKVHANYLNQAVNGGYSNWGDHAAVKSPCLAGGVLYSAQNMSAAPNATLLSFCEAADDATRGCAVRNVSAPDACIYRQTAPFATAVRQTLMTAFTGRCGWLGNRPQACESGTREALTNTAQKWLSELGTAAGKLPGSWPPPGPQPSPVFTQLMDAYFRRFAQSMTDHYRAVLGGQAYHSSMGFALPEEGLPAGTAAGRTWQTTSCTATALPWLALPVALTAATASLLAWVVARSWTHRHRHPVWKDSLLPLVLYKERLLLGGEGGPGALGPLLDLDHLGRVAAETPVRLLCDGEPVGASSRRRKETADVDSLLIQS